MGESKYDEPIKKAAYYVAYEAQYDNWAAVRGTALTFLAEYYLRTKDRGILEGLRRSVARSEETVFMDYSVGHGTRLAGYGIGGMNIGASHILAGLAVASKTPVSVNPKILEGMMDYAASIAVDGYIPYGRYNSAPREGKYNRNISKALTCPTMGRCATRWRAQRIYR